MRRDACPGDSPPSSYGPLPLKAFNYSLPTFQYLGCYKDNQQGGQRAFAQNIRGTDLAGCLKAAMDAGETLFAAQHPQGYCGGRFQCFFEDKGVLGDAPYFEEVADQQCRGERWSDDYNGVTATNPGSGDRNAVYMIVPPLPMG